MEKDRKMERAIDASTDTAADVEAIMRKYDRESNTRIWEGTPKIIVSCVAVLFSLFCLYVTLFANFMEQVRLSSFLGALIVIGYLTYPAKKGKVHVNAMPWYDIVLMALGAGAFFFYVVNAKYVVKLNMRITKETVYIVVGLIGLLSLAELCRRSVGLPILCVAGVFVAYTVVNQWNKGGIPLIIYRLFYGDGGVLSTPINVCSKYIVVFIIFGAFLERTGIEDFFINLANGLCGRFAGGPAKVAVVASAFEGMVSGSSVANTVGSGSITIPMMKKLGYKPEFAGAVEAAASTGGQIMPPIMGAAAFLMAEYVGAPYSNIIVRAILPAVLYFLGIFIAVHLEAKKLGLRGVPKEMLPRVGELIRDSYLLLPLIILVYLVSSNTKTMQFSAAIAILMAIAVGVINNVVRYCREKKAGGEMTNTSGSAVKAAVGIGGGFGPKSIFDALDAGGRGCITVGVACGIAGVIAGCLTVTGLASKMINAIVGISGASSLLALVLTMLCCIVLGMGVPTTANYCIMASTCAPILIQMGIPTIAAHFFVFYFGIVADITPPVALAAYAGSAIAQGNPMKTGLTATRLAIAAFIIPFVFAYSPMILFVGESILWYEVALTVITAVIGMIGVAAGLSGYLLGNMNIVQRIVTILGGVLLIIPGVWTDAAGIALVAIAVVWQMLEKKNK